MPTTTYTATKEDREKLFTYGNVMGYDTRVFIGRPSDFIKDREGKTFWFQVDCMMEVGSGGPLIPAEAQKQIGIPIHFLPDGDTERKIDCYGDSLYAIPIKEFLNHLEEKIKEESQYIRYRWLRDTLKSMTKRRRKGDHGTQPTHIFLFGH